MDGLMSLREKVKLPLLVQKTKDIAASIDDLILEIQEDYFISSQKELDNEIQEEISRLLIVLRKLKGVWVKTDRDNKEELKTLVLNVKTAIIALRCGANKELISNIVKDADLTIQRYQRSIKHRTPTKVIQGLVLALFLYTSIPLILATVLGQAANILGYTNLICQDELITLDFKEKRISSSWLPDEEAKNWKTVTVDLETRSVVINNDVNNSIKIPDGENYQKVYVNPNCLSSNEYDETAALIILAFITGATGSIVSILTRIEQYQDQNYEDTNLPFWIGLFKPIIGGAFGILLFVILASGFVPISIQPHSTEATEISIEKWLTVMTFAFVAGFSERFAKDIVGRAEQLGTGTNSNRQNGHVDKTSTD